jgi:hypothetical protein
VKRKFGARDCAGCLRENQLEDLAQEVVGAKVVKQRGTGPSAVKLGGPVRPDEKESIS